MGWVRGVLVLATAASVGLAVAPPAGAAPAPGVASASLAPELSAPASAADDDLLLPAGEVPRAAPREGRPLSGSIESDGHEITWTVTGAEACPPEVLAEAPDCSGVIRPGGTVSLTGSTSFTIGEGYVTNLSQSVGLSVPGVPSKSESWSDRVGGGTFSHTWTITMTLPKTVSAPKAGVVSGYGSASVSSRNCNDWGVCGGPSVSLQLALVPGSSSSDITKPTVRVPTVTGFITKYPVTVPVYATDDSGKVKVHGALYSGGTRVGGADTPGFYGNGRYSYTMKSMPKGNGPYFLCAWAEDQAGNRSQGAPKSSCTWLSIKVPASRWSNGCGSDGVAEGWLGKAALWLQNFMGNTRVYGGKHEVLVKTACDVHDAAYAGVTIYDPFARKLVDFRTWDRARIDKKFQTDIRTQCRRYLTLPAERKYLSVCQNGWSIGKAGTYFAAVAATTSTVLAWKSLQNHVGANVYYQAVREYGGVGFDADLTVPGTQTERPARTVPTGGARTNN